MPLPTRYILRQLAGPAALVVFTLTGIAWLTESLRISNQILANAGVFGIFLRMSIDLLPQILSLVLPSAAFIATAYAYSRLVADFELVVLWSSGLSTLDLIKPALILSGGLTVAAYALVLYLMPLGSRAFNDLRWDIRSNPAYLSLQEGKFNNVAQGLTVYVRQRDSNGELHGILIYDSRRPNHMVTIMAERGVLVRAKDGPHVVMVNGNRQEMNEKTHELSLLYFKRDIFDIGGNAQRTGERWRNDSERFLGQLLWPGDSSYARQSYWKFVVEAHRRLTLPLQIPALALIALAAVLGGEFNRRGRSQRVAIAAIAAAVEQMIFVAVTRIAVEVHPLIALLYIVPLATGFVALHVALRGPKAPRRFRTTAAAPG